MHAALGSRWAKAASAIAVVLACAATIPRAVCGRGADALYDGDRAAVEPLARAVAGDVLSGVSASAFHTGSARFDGEWLVVTHTMAAIGLAQVGLAHPELAGALRPAIARAAERLLAPDATAFGAEAWGERGMDSLASSHGHAYLGYVGVALGALRLVDPHTPLAPVHDALAHALAQRVREAPYGVIETYPGESYPADVAAVVAAIALHARATGEDERATLAQFAETFRARWIDPASGLAYQAADAARGRPAGPPRASGTGLAAYFLAFADLSLSRDLYSALAAHEHASFFGFGGIREYPAGTNGSGDIDSGPVLLGVSIAASGFAIGSARIHGDRALYRELYRTADLFGVPVDQGERRRFATGGPLGNAILLAMLTARALP